MTSSSMVKTRLLILSDTHGMSSPIADINPTHHCADVAIHCGDMTDGSLLSEYHTILDLLKHIDAPLKLVIAGNHDFTLDIPAFQRKVAESSTSAQRLDPDLVAQTYGNPGAVRALFDSPEVREQGIIFLDEGTHQFHLSNGALLTVYASPYTPSLGCGWGFQYRPDQQRKHDFLIGQDVDIAITHGPPRGIMDFAHGRERAGCPQLFTAVAHARPKIHCFGHIHEGWGAKLVTWKDESMMDKEKVPTHFTAIDNNRSFVVENIAGLRPSRFGTEEDKSQKIEKVRRLKMGKCVKTSHCADDVNPIRKGQQTLFVNASIAGSEEGEVQRPWLVDIDLPRA